MFALLSQWSRRGRTKGDTLALTLDENSIRYVLGSASDGRTATLVAWGCLLRGNQTRDAFLKHVKNLLPVAERVIAVLDPKDYQILQVESPTVPPNELRSAVRWRAMEFIDGAPDDYTFDLLSLPAEEERAANVIVVVAHNDIVRKRMLDCKMLGHALTVIDVVETAQRNLLHAALLNESPIPVVAAALVADAGRALMVITVQGQLHFFRRFEFDTDILAAVVDELQTELIGTGAGREAASRSLMQLHRSLDLWEDSYPHLPLRALRVDAGAKTDVIIDRLVPETGVDTRKLAFSSIFKMPASNAPPPWHEPAYLPLLGALLRPSTLAS